MKSLGFEMVIIFLFISLGSLSFGPKTPWVFFLLEFSQKWYKKACFRASCDSTVPGRALLDPSSSTVLFVPAVVEYVVVLAASARSRVDRPSSPRSVHVRGGEAVPGPGRSSRPSGRRRSRDGYALVDTTMVKRSLHPAEIQIVRARGVNTSIV